MYIFNRIFLKSVCETYVFIQVIIMFGYYFTTNRAVADRTSSGLAIHLTSTTYSPG